MRFLAVGWLDNQDQGMILHQINNCKKFVEQTSLKLSLLVIKHLARFYKNIKGKKLRIVSKQPPLSSKFLKKAVGVSYACGQLCNIYIHLLKKNRNLFSDANVNEKTNIGTTFGSFSPLEVRCSLAKIPFCYVESLIFKSDPYLIILKAKLPRALKIFLELIFV